MKVLFLTNVPSPYRVKFFNELGKFCDLTVVYERRSASDRDIRWVADSSKNYIEIYLHGIRIGSDNSFSLEMLTILRQNDFDKIVIGMYSTYTAILAINYLNRKNVPFYISTDGGFIKDEGKLKYKLKRRLISSASYWFVTGNSALEYLQHYGADINRCYPYPFTSVSQKEVLECAIDEEEKNNVRKKMGLPQKYTIVSVGQFIYRKGFDILLKALPQLQFDTEVYIIGGRETEEFSNICMKYKLSNVHFLDFMKKEELSNYFIAANLFVLPTREDVWGLVINEALSYRLPVVTSCRCLAGVELIGEGLGSIINDVEDAGAYAEAINKIYSGEMKIDYDEIGRVAKRYTIENMARTIFQTLEET